VQNSERMLVPLPSELAGLRARDGRIDVPRLLPAAAFGLALEAQRRLLDATAAVAGRFGWPLRVLGPPSGGAGVGGGSAGRCRRSQGRRSRGMLARTVRPRLPLRHET
jgi:hypothetical protein